VGDVYSRGLDIQISDLNLEVEIQKLIETYNHIDLEQALFEMGFKHIDLQTIFSKGTQITRKLKLFASI
jgi:F0F1-type ATP synthase beta subunit